MDLLYNNSDKIINPLQYMKSYKLNHRFHARSRRDFSICTFRDVSFRSNIPFYGVKCEEKVQANVTEGTFCDVFLTEGLNEN